MDDLRERLEIHELDTLYNIPLLNALGISYRSEAADSELSMDDAGFSWLMFVGGTGRCLDSAGGRAGGL